MRLPSACVLLLLFLGIAGCGGSSSSSPRYVTAQVQISWLERARIIGGPESALSVSLSFSAKGQNGQLPSFTENRLSAPAAYTQSYSSTTGVATGAQTLSVGFWSSTNGTGTEVASTTIDVKVGSDGTLTKTDGSALGSIQLAGVVGKLSLTALTLVQGQPTDPVVTAISTAGQYIAISSGSVFYQITPGSGTATVNSQGQIVGESQGTITLTATVDGVSSQPASFTILGPLLQVSVMPQAIHQMVMDVQTGHIWASTPPTVDTYANCVIEVDPATEKVLTYIPIGDDPDALAISDDGTTLYVGMDNSLQIAKVDLIGKQVLSMFHVQEEPNSISPNASNIAVEPGNPNVISVTEQDYNAPTFHGGCIFQDGTLLQNCFGSSNGQISAFSSPTKLWASNPTSYPQGLFSGIVNSSGATLQSTDTSLNGTFKVANGNLYFIDGQVVSGASGTLLGTFALGVNTNWPTDVAVDTTAGRAFFIGNLLGTTTGTYTELRVFDTAGYQPVATVTLPYPSGPIQGLTRWGANGLAYSDGAINFISQVPGLTPQAATRPMHRSLLR